MANLSFSQLESVWISAGGTAAMAPLMAAIALAESSGDPNSTNPTDNNGTQTSWGLWQISNGDHSEPAPNWNDPIENARLALGKLHSQGLGAWGTYTSGAYKRYYQGDVPPSGYTGGAAPAGPTASTTVAATWYEPWTWLGGITSDVARAIANVFGPVSGFIFNLNEGLVAGMHGVLWLVNPANWVRIFAGAIGTVALIAGMIFVAKSA